MMKGGMGNMLKQMQQQMQKDQEAFTKREFTGQAGAGQVTITITGSYNVRRVQLDSSLRSEDVEIIEDLIGAAFNDAVHQVSKEQQALYGQLTQNLPFKLPF